jgi:hypothetical protein
MTKLCEVDSSLAVTPRQRAMKAAALAACEACAVLSPVAADVARSGAVSPIGAIIASGHFTPGIGQFLS